jgi:hypothetical protein
MNGRTQYSVPSTIRDINAATDAVAMVTETDKNASPRRADDVSDGGRGFGINLTERGNPGASSRSI